jgi:hypothetical protein
MKPLQQMPPTEAWTTVIPKVDVLNILVALKDGSNLGDEYQRGHDEALLQMATAIGMRGAFLAAPVGWEFSPRDFVPAQKLVLNGERR